MKVLLLLAFALPLHTPGVIRPLTLQQICSTQWGRDHRYVTLAMKQEVAHRYNIPRSRWSLYEFDHLIPRELGGADSTDNLWPQPLVEAHVKDVRENALHRAVCNGTVTLQAAQLEMKQWGR